MSEDPKALTLAIKALGKRRLWQEALGLFDRVRSAGRADIILHTAAISACERSSEWERAVELLRCVLNDQRVEAGAAFSHRGAWRGGGTGGGGAVPAFASAMGACLRGSEWPRALALFDQIRREGLAPSIVSYNVAINACASGDLWTRALALLAEAEAGGSSPPTIITYSAAMNACGVAARWDAALSLLHELKRRMPLDVIACSSAIAACEKAHRWTLALDLLTSMKVEGPQPNVISFNLQ